MSPPPPNRLRLPVLGHAADLSDTMSSLLDVVALGLRVAEGEAAEAVSQAQAEGKAISCRSGCAACCRQLLVISLPEAVHVADLVAAMPAERQAAVRARFADVVRRLEESGLLDRHEPRGARHLHAPEGVPPDQAVRAVAVKYFALGLPCPFLEDESCSIYAGRPAICREYHVASPAEWCRKLFESPVDRVLPDLHMGPVLMTVGRRVAGLPSGQVPLTLALEWAPVVGPAVRAERDGGQLLSVFADTVREFANPPVPAPPEETVTADVELRIAQRRIRLKLTVPTGLTRPRDLLPIAHAVADLATRVATEDRLAAGQTVSCRAGCGACCRQLVPLSEPEAHQLAELVSNLPEPRRSHVQARFAGVLDRLGQAGLREPLRNTAAIAPTERTALGLAYFRLGLPCPFLENESCSIYPDRPLACREFLVTSPAENCQQPAADNIRRVELPTRPPLRTFGEFSSAVGPEDPFPWVPLAFAPEWAADHAEPAADAPGPIQAERLFRHMTGGS